MTLKDWLKKHQMSQAAFAKVVKTDQAHISDLANRKILPSMRTVGIITTATNGAVTFVDWYEPGTEYTVTVKKTKAGSKIVPTKKRKKVA